MGLLKKQVSKGKRVKPLAILIYGVEGVGKSSLLKDNPNTIYMGCEENDELDVDRLPIVRKKLDIENQLTALMEEDHDYKTLVFDGFDMVERIIAADILRNEKNKNATMESARGGYGKAWAVVEKYYSKLIKKYLIPLREKRGMNIILTAHSVKAKHEDPETQTAYDTYSPSFHKRCAPVIKEWVSAILFINQKRAVDSDDKIINLNGMRVIYTEERASQIAKNRFDLPYEIRYEKTGTWKTILGHIGKYYADAKPYEAPKEVKNVTPKKKVTKKKKVEPKEISEEENKEIEEALEKELEQQEEVNESISPEVEALKDELYAMASCMDNPAHMAAANDFIDKTNDIEQLNALKAKLEI